ncbi:hypothetical protein CR513_55030, partial [Mucuna pruriens]
MVCDQRYNKPLTIKKFANILNKDNRARVVHYESVDPMKDDTMILFCCKKKGCIRRGHSNLKKDPNSKD